MAFFSQIGLMLWKNWIIQRRKICVTIFEVILPLFFAASLLLMRATSPSEDVTNAITYPIQSLNSVSKGNDFRHNSALYFIIGYTPNRPEVNKVVDYMDKMFQTELPDVNATFKGFHDEEAMLKFFKKTSDHMRHCVTFKNIGKGKGGSSLPQDLEFAVRPYTDKLWQTSMTFDPIQSNEPRFDNDNMYEKRGVLYLQRLVGEALIKYWLSKTGGNSSSVNLGAYTQRMAYPSYINDKMIGVFQIIFPLILIFSFILSVIVNTKNLVYEKEMKLKESMKLMGLKASVHWISWFITFCVYLIPSLAVYTLLICADIVQSKGPILQQSDGFLVFVFLLLYGLSLITFCFMVASFVQKANVGAALSGILFFCTFCPYFYLENNYVDLGKSTKLGVSLLFNCAVGLGAKVIGLYEGTGEGVQWNNFHKPASVDDNLSLLECMIMLGVDSFWHLLVFWYLDNVWPGDFGVPKPYYFCFMKSYWCGGETSKDSREVNEIRESKRFEREPRYLNAGIKIRNLRKVFGNKVAVDNLSFNMFEGQISVLLGHNGAGKTTVMSMLTGFIPPSSGDALVNGYDITENIDGVRSSLGLCPQHNILFDTLTVKEHLQFFARLKGASNKQAEAEIGPLLKEVGLESKIYARTASLSGGQKRKLSVAIALIAGSKIVILDEPTSGMDPAARRQTWNVLQNHREGRTIVLTTHYMDEADVLGDRIAIMTEGVVKCCGSSMFLKKLYGAGYHLVVVKKQSCNVDMLTDVIKSHLSRAKLESTINQEVMYLLPEKETAKFPNLFTELERKRENLGIDSFGTSATTMEEVFLKVGDSSSAAADEPTKHSEMGQNKFFNPSYNSGSQSSEDDSPTCFANNKVDTSDNNRTTIQSLSIMEFNRGFEKKTGFALEISRMHALVVKKAIHSWRNRTITLVQLLLPVFFTAFGLFLDAIEPGLRSDPPLNFDLAKFGHTFIPTTAGINPTADDTRLRTYYDKQFGTHQTIEFVNLTKYDTYDNYTLKRVQDLGIGTFNKRVIVGLEVQAKGPGESIHAISHYNGQPLHAQPIGVNYLMNAFLQFYLNSSSYSLQSSIDPLPLDREQEARNNIEITSANGFLVGLFISFGMAFLTTLFIHYLIKERQVGAKHLQVVSGVNPFSYWIPTFLWDFIIYIIPSVLILVVLAGFQKTAYIGDARWLIVILLLIMFGWGMLPFMYALQFAFHEPPTGVVVVTMLNIFSGLFCLLVTFILRIQVLGMVTVVRVLNTIFIVLFPSYSMAQGFVDIYSNYDYNKICGAIDCNLASIHPCCQDCKHNSVCYEYQSNYLSLETPGIGLNLLCLAVQGCFYFLIVFLIEYKIFQKIMYLLQGSSKGPELHRYENRANMAEDSDVAEERRRINSTPASALRNMDSLLLVNLFKQYGSFVAVDHLSVGIPQQECFGLLGQNGAGKTTTFKMLTGDIMVSGGDAYLSGYDLRQDIKQFQANMGYCPQFDALIDQMTGKETLVMYARLRGVPEESINPVVNHLIDILMLRPHANKMSGNYSGGNKRKLSTAIALVGDPQFIMLDEPSAGMDPKARRQLWNVLSQVRASGRTLVLTSHSMEECDALCTRLAIMVNGRFVCLGSPQHLKNKFGQGYTLVVQLGSLRDGTTAPIAPVVNFVCENFPGTVIFDDHEGYIHFQVPDATIKLANVFSLMESTKVNLNVRDYSVHQTTLEQVFLSFTRSQYTPKDPKRRNAFTRVCCCVCIKHGCMK